VQKTGYHRSIPNPPEYNLALRHTPVDNPEIPSLKHGNTRMTTFALPSQLPCMVLSETVLYPSTALPLYLFEPRYRTMLDNALSGECIFGIVAPLASSHGGNEWNTLAPVATAGFIKACQTHPDGTSNLILEGIARMAVHGWTNDTYPILEVSPLRTTPIARAPGMRLCGHVLRLIRAIHPKGDNPEIDSIIQHIEAIEEPEAFADTAAFLFAGKNDVKQAILESQDVRQRFQILISDLQEQRIDQNHRKRMQHNLSDDDLSRN